MNFNELKARAKLINRQSNPSVFTAAFIFVMVTALLQYLSDRILGAEISRGTLQNLQDAMNNGNYDYVSGYLAKLQPSGLEWLIGLVISLVSFILMAGFIIFIINTIRNNSPVYQNLLDGFSNAGKLVLLYFLESLFIALWSMLLVVPGIIAAYRYRMAIYILLDNPEMGVMECIKKSKEMMKGHKWELFSLDLSFLGWYILGGIVFLVKIYTAPYTRCTYVLYYQHLAGIVDYTEAVRV